MCSDKSLVSMFGSAAKAVTAAVASAQNAAPARTSFFINHSGWGAKLRDPNGARRAGLARSGLARRDRALPLGDEGGDAVEDALQAEFEVLFQAGAGVLDGLVGLADADDGREAR